MSENYRSEKIGVTALCRVSAKGGEGIYLYIPKHYAVMYGITGSDYAEVTFVKLFFKVAESRGKSSKTIDMRQVPKKEKKATIKTQNKGADKEDDTVSIEDNDLQKGNLE